MLVLQPSTYQIKGKHSEGAIVVPLFTGLMTLLVHYNPEVKELSSNLCSDKEPPFEVFLKIASTLKSVSWHFGGNKMLKGCSHSVINSTLFE